MPVVTVAVVSVVAVFVTEVLVTVVFVVDGAGSSLVSCEMSDTQVKYCENPSGDI